MEDIRYTFKVNSKKVKTTLILVSLFIFLCFSAITVVGYIRGLPVLAFPFLFGLMFSLSIFILLWLYGKYRIFGLEWQLCDDGLRILKSGQEIRFIPWKDIADIESGYKIIDGRDKKRFAITLPPIVRKDMVEKMYELKECKINPGSQNLRTTYFSKEPWGLKKFLLTTFLIVFGYVFVLVFAFIYLFLLAILDVLFPSLHISKNWWIALIAWTPFLASVFCFLYFDQRKWHLLEKLRNLFLGRDNPPKW